MEPRTVLTIKLFTDVSRTEYATFYRKQKITKFLS